jgi:hypothetical protein
LDRVVRIFAVVVIVGMVGYLILGAVLVAFTPQ